MTDKNRSLSDTEGLSRSNLKSRKKATSSDFAPQTEGEVATGHSTHLNSKAKKRLFWINSYFAEHPQDADYTTRQAYHQFYRLFRALHQLEAEMKSQYGLNHFSTPGLLHLVVNPVYHKIGWAAYLSEGARRNLEFRGWTSYRRWEQWLNRNGRIPF